MPIRVLAAVVCDGDKYLICRRPAHKRHGGLWEFPGGKIETGESDLEATARELREELDVEVTHVEPALLIRADEGSDFVIEFVPTTVRGEPNALEHSEIAWVPAGMLSSYDLAPSDRVFVDTHFGGGKKGPAG